MADKSGGGRDDSIKGGLKLVAQKFGIRGRIASGDFNVDINPFSGVWAGKQLADPSVTVRVETPNVRDGIDELMGIIKALAFSNPRINARLSEPVRYDTGQDAIEFNFANTDEAVKFFKDITEVVTGRAASLAS